MDKLPDLNDALNSLHLGPGESTTNATFKREKDHIQAQRAAKQCFTQIKKLLEEYSQKTPQSLGDFRDVVDVQRLLENGIKELGENVRSLSDGIVKVNDLYEQMKNSSSRKLQRVEQPLEMNEKNIFAYLEEFKFLSVDPEDKENHARLLELYGAFCQYARQRQLPQEIRVLVATIAMKHFPEAACVFVVVESKLFPVLKICLAELRHSSLQALSDEKEVPKTVPIEGISIVAFREIVNFISNPNRYQLPKNQGPDWKNTLMELVKMAGVYRLDSLRKQCEEGLKPFVNSQNAKEIYEMKFEGKRKCSLVHKHALNQFKGLKSPFSGWIEIDEVFFETDLSSLPKIKMPALDLTGLTCGLSSNRLQILAQVFSGIKAIQWPFAVSHDITAKDFQCFPKLQRIALSLHHLDLDANGQEKLDSIFKDTCFLDSLEQASCHLALIYDSYREDPSLIQILERYAPVIGKLYWPHISPETLNQFLGRLPRLESLTITGAHIVACANALSKQNHPLLKELEVWDFDKQADELRTIARECPQLKVLKLIYSDCAKKDLGFLEEKRDLGFLGDLLSLESLEIDDVAKEEIDQLFELLPRLSSLKSLTLRGISGFQNSSGILFTKGLELLEHPDINQRYLQKIIQLLLKAHPGLKIDFTHPAAHSAIEAWAIYRANLEEYQKITSILIK